MDSILIFTRVMNCAAHPSFQVLINDHCFVQMDGANVLLVSFLRESVYFDIIQFKQSAFVRSFVNYFHV